MASAPTLSALIVAHNEETRLAACLEAVAFCDEIVVVLDRCTDGSEAIARRYTDRIIIGGWPLEADRRNLGIEECRCDWILEVDADEIVTPELAAEIRATLPDTPASYINIPYLNYIGSRPVQYGWGAFNSVTIKSSLFRKGAKTWDRQIIHPKVKVSGSKIFLKNPMLHYVDRDFTDMVNRLNRYTSAYARQIADDLTSGSRKPETTGRWLRRGLSRFWKVYVARKGYKEGYIGLMLGLFAALYPVLSYLKARELMDKR